MSNHARDSQFSLTAERLRELLDYDPGTGAFTWRNLNGRGHARVAGTVAGHLENNGYIRITVGQRRYQAHRLAWLHVHGEWPSQLDHRDGDKTNNRIANLRIASTVENCRNRPTRSNKEIGFKGVFFHKAMGRFTATIKIAGKQIPLGYFDDPAAAYEAYCQAAIKHYGEFARLK